MDFVSLMRECKEAGKEQEAKALGGPSSKASEKPESLTMPPPVNTAPVPEPEKVSAATASQGGSSGAPVSSQDAEMEPPTSGGRKRKHPGRNVTMAPRKEKMGCPACTSAGFSLLAGREAPLIVPSALYQAIPLAQFNPSWDYQVNDRFNLETCVEFSSCIVPPMEKRVMATLEETEVDSFMRLDLTQGLFLATELSTRLKKKNDEILQLHSELVKSQQEREEAEKRQSETDQELALLREENRKLKKNKTLSEKASTQKARNKNLVKEKKSLEARSEFYSGEGASKLVKNLFASSSFAVFMAGLCNSVLDQGSTSAYKEVKKLHPDIEVDKLPGYDEKSTDNLNILMTNLSSGQVHFPVEDFVPFFPAGPVAPKPSKGADLGLKETLEVSVANLEESGPAGGDDKKGSPVEEGEEALEE